MPFALDVWALAVLMRGLDLGTRNQVHSWLWERRSQPGEPYLSVTPILNRHLVQIGLIVGPDEEVLRLQVGVSGELASASSSNFEMGWAGMLGPQEEFRPIFTWAERHRECPHLGRYQALGSTCPLRLEVQWLADGSSSHHRSRPRPLLRTVLRLACPFHARQRHRDSRSEPVLWETALESTREILCQPLNVRLAQDPQADPRAALVPPFSDSDEAERFFGVGVTPMRGQEGRVFAEPTEAIPPPPKPSRVPVINTLTGDRYDAATTEVALEGPNGRVVIVTLSEMLRHYALAGPDRGRSRYEHILEGDELDES